MNIGLGIAIPTYNRSELLNDLLNSIPEAAPVWVSDNGGLTEKGKINRNVNLEFSGCADVIPMFSNWNRAARLVTPDQSHVIIPSDDDKYLAGGLEHIRDILVQNPEADMIVCGCDLIDESGSVFHTYRPERDEILVGEPAFRKFIKGVDARMPAIAFKRTTFEKLGGLDSSFELTAADSDLVQRCALNGKVVFSTTVVGQYRVWRGSLTHAKIASDQWMAEIEKWLKKIDVELDNGSLDLQADWRKARAEIAARNLLSAIGLLYAGKRYEELIQFRKKYPIPAGASLRTVISIARRSFVSRLKILATRHC
ncbi:hypothetical protein [Pseudacidovorax intermedius]|uniref:hypothetical protein n=1 Tax=Pseudacidovorax intermedius TaxID=433924 RepID=UPI000ABC17EB|nr:hypothetical protein [Pseudacidovorax intermedius]